MLRLEVQTELHACRVSWNQGFRQADTGDRFFALLPFSPTSLSLSRPELVL